MVNFPPMEISRNRSTAHRSALDSVCWTRHPGSRAAVANGKIDFQFFASVRKLFVRSVDCSCTTRCVCVNKFLCHYNFHDSFSALSPCSPFAAIIHVVSASFVGCPVGALKLTLCQCITTNNCRIYAFEQLFLVFERVEQATLRMKKKATRSKLEKSNLCWEYSVVSVEMT